MNVVDLVTVPISYLILVFIAAGARFMLVKETPTVKLLMAVVVWGLAIVMSTHDLVIDVSTSETGKLNKGMATTITAFSAFVAKDILEFILKLMEQIKKDPLSLLRDLLNKMKPPSNGDN